MYKLRTSMSFDLMQDDSPVHVPYVYVTWAIARHHQVARPAQTPDTKQHLVNHTQVYYSWLIILIV